MKLLEVGRIATADPEARRRFVREARSSASFTHPHAVTVFDAGEADGELFIVMELVDGPSLAEAMADRGQMPEGDAVRIATQVLSALGAAHATGIVHRDVKPANILLDARDDAKLADFGIAKRFDDLTDSLTATGLIVGTPRYLSPEQARGEPISPATDIYAVGVILHEMLAGAPPFADESLLATANRARLPTPRVDIVRPGVSRSVADAVVRSLAPDPADRFDSADAMINALLAPTAPIPHAAASQAPSTAAVGAGPTQGAGSTVMTPAATQVMPHPPGSTRRSRALVAFGALCLVGLAVIAIAARSDEPSASELVAAADDTTVGTSEAAVTTPTTTPVTESTAVVTIAPTVPPTEPPAPTAPPVDDLVPGFPVPADIEVFLVQVQNDPTVIGASGIDVQHELERVLREKSRRKRADRANELIDHLDEWADSGTIEPVVAEFLVELLAPYAGDGPGGDGDGEGDD